MAIVKTAWHLIPFACVGWQALNCFGADLPRRVLPDPQKHLAFDPRVFETTRNAHLVVGKVVKDPANPLFCADRPWENALNNLYPNVSWDEQERQFRLWYKCVLADKDAISRMDRPSTVHDVGWYLL